MLAGDLSNVDVEVATALEEAHVRDTRTFFTRTRFTRGGGAIIQVSHRITIAIVTRLVDNILEFVLLSFAAFLLAQDARIFDLLLERSHNAVEHVEHRDGTDRRLFREGRSVEGNRRKRNGACIVQLNACLCFAQLAAKLSDLLVAIGDDRIA